MARILFIEDNKLQAKAGKSSLEDRGHEVTLAEDGKSAIKAAASGNFDIVVLDLVLPDMHGTQICQWMKQNESTRLIPVIMLTSRTSVNDRVSGLEAGADDYLEKPYNASELNARIKACLRTKALQDELSEKNRELEKLLKEVERLAITDHLTGLYNRRHFNSMLQREYNSAVRYKRPLACLLLDIDHFKSINDRFGHHVGDIVLKEVSAALQSTLRNVDIISRWGGEEFVVLLPQTGFDECLEAADRLLSEVSSRSYQGLEDRTVTISIGVCCLPSEDIKSAEELVNAADQALYTAKENGRNRVETYNPA